MSRNTDPSPLGDLIGRLLQRHGLEDLGTWNRIRDEWEDVAPAPWNRHSRPMALTRGTLVVEASNPSAVSLLRYAVASLQATLAARYGEGTVRQITVRGPASSSRSG